jgi:type I restriction enzyme, S subunit
MQSTPHARHVVFETVPLGAVAQINPRRDLHGRASDAPTSFVPMAAIDESTGSIVNLHAQPYEKVSKGYTFFRENDVLFAKITPCIENGKIAIATGLSDGIGFGTTELHVLRAGPRILPEWIYYFLRRPDIREDAANHFTGAVGQQRIPEDWLETVALPLPTLDEQKRIVEGLKNCIAREERARQAVDAQMRELESLRSTILRAAFTGHL